METFRFSRKRTIPHIDMNDELECQPIRKAGKTRASILYDKNHEHGEILSVMVRSWQRSRHFMIRISW